MLPIPVRSSHAGQSRLQKDLGDTMCRYCYSDADEFLFDGFDNEGLVDLPSS
jgi:hypothetical protein